jgi:hypothetical protein
MWETFTSDVAVHGLAYLGVLLTFVSVLGFLLFAFKDLPIPAKPFVELFIVLTFFGWAWLLHRQQATRVAQAMEILGGMVLPLVWYAGLVDSAAFPPDADGNALVVALTLSSLAISGIYWLMSRRYLNSMLRFLVWPMVWTAALGVGLAFKTDEYLIGDAITRLVAPQPALASIAIAASLGFLAWRSDSRLAAPTYTAALVGIPSAYLLTFGLSVGDGSAAWWPIIVSGAGTIASVELVAHWNGWQEKLRSLRPYVYALVGVPLVLAIGLGWGGAIVVVTYVALAEIAIRSPKLKVHDAASASAGVAVGLALSLAEPGAAVAAFSVLSVWAHLRRRTVTDDARVARSLNAVAAIAPAGLLFGLSALTTVPTAVLTVSSLVLAGSIALRVLNKADEFDVIWWPAAATAMGIGAAIFWAVDGTDAYAAVASLGMSAATVALGRRWPTINLWLGSALATIAIAIALETLGTSGAITALVWSSVGAGTIVVSLSTNGGARFRIGAGHLTALGQVFGLFAFTASAEPFGFTIAITGWAIGWAVSFAASERQGGVDPLEIWSKTFAVNDGTSPTLADQLQAAVPTMSALTAVAATIAIFIETATVEDHRLWIGVVVAALAIAYASATRWLIQTDHGRTIFGWAAAILAVAGVALASTEPRAVIATALALVVVRVVLLRVLPLIWLTWVTWLVPAVIATALASEFGLARGSLAVMVLGIGSVQLLGALALDEARNGTRQTGEFTRSAWVLPPALIGAVLIPAGVAALYVAGSSISDWAAAMAVLTFAFASVMLRRSVWLTATLGSIALAIGLGAAHVPAIESAIVWSVAGLVALASSIIAPKLHRDDVAAIGHAIGAVGLAYAFDQTALVIAMSAWATGWLAAVLMSERGGPSVTHVVARSAGWWDESYAPSFAAAAQGLVPVAAVATTTAAVLLVYGEFADPSHVGKWIGAVVAGLGLAYAVAGPHAAKVRITRLVFGWSGISLVAAAIVIALPENLPVAIAATMFIAARLAVGRLIPLTWLTWVTWLMPTIAITALAREMDVSDASLAVVPIVTGGVMLLGALFVDDVLNERRMPGDLVRTNWLIAPAVIGATLMVLGLGLLQSAGTDIRLWATVSVAFTLAAASLVVRQSIWLTSILGAVGLAMMLEAAGATATESTIVWASIGLLILALAPFVKEIRGADLAAIGHLLGAAAFAYPQGHGVSLIALTAWAIGWLMSVTSAEFGRPSVADIFTGWSTSSDDDHGASIGSIAAAIPPLLAVVTSTAAALLLYDEFASFSGARAWTAAVIAGVGLVLAATSRYVITSRPTLAIFGWSSVILAAASVMVAIGEDLPIIVAASAFIVVRILLIGVIGHTWLSWPAWLMPTVIVVSLGHFFGVPNDSLYLLTLATGAAMLVGSLVADDALNTRRRVGEGLRTNWLRYPFVIGLLIVPFSLAPIFALDVTTVGIASLAAALGYLLVAVLLRSGSVTAPAIGLAALGTSLLLPESPLDSPWILVSMAALTTGWSFLAERFQSTESAASPWTRWDLAPLAMAQLLAGTAVLLTLDGSPDPVTWVAAGALSMVIGVWRHNRWLLDAGLLLVIVGSGFAGEPWLLMALIVGTARGMYGVWHDRGIERYVDHAIAVIAFGAAWIEVAMSLEWSYLEVVGFGSMTAGAVAVSATALSGLGLVKKDTFLLWSGFGTAGVVAAVIAGFNARPIAIDGPWLAVSIWLVAVTSVRWARLIHRNIRCVTPVVAASGWAVLLTGLNVSLVDSAALTAIVFGIVLVVSVFVANRTVVRSPSEHSAQLNLAARAWAIIALGGISVSTAIAISNDSRELWLAVALGLASVTVATALGGRALGINRLRIATGAPALGALAAVLMAFDTSSFGIGVAMTAVVALATLTTVLLVVRNADLGWIESSLVAGYVATAITVPIALIALPATQLIVVLLVAIGGQTISYGITFNRDALLAFGPPALGLATITLLAESASETALWFTVPIAVVLLAEADILHRMTAGARDEKRSTALLILEWSGIALLSLPPIIEMFTTDVAFGLLGFGFAVGLLMWALLTRVKRRVLAAAVVATLSVMLTLAAAAASNAPANAAFWIIGGGVGFSIMLIAGLVEAYRSRSGALMTRLGDLMEDWE